MVDQTANSVVRVNATTGARVVVSSDGSLVDPTGIAIASNGDIYVADPNAFGGNGGVIRVNQLTGVQTTVSSGDLFVDPSGIAIASNGDLFVADREAFGGDGGVIHVDPLTQAQTHVSSGGSFKDPDGVAIASDGNLLVAESYQSEVIRVVPSTGDQTPVSSDNNMDKPTGIALGPTGDIFVADYKAFSDDGGVIKVDPSSGAQTIVSSNDLFQHPTGVVVLGSGDLAVVDKDAFSGTGGVIRVGALGAQTAIATGGVFQDPVGIALPPDADGDEAADYADNCPAVANAAQSNLDGDSAGDACDSDDDGDGLSDAAEPGLGTDPLNADTDADGSGDGTDNCRTTANAGQADLDADGSGDACDVDDDADTVLDGADNCPRTPNRDQADTDGDRAGDRCDEAPEVLPPPRLGATVNLAAVSGVVRIVLPARASAARSSSFSRLTAPQQVPVGTLIDVRRGIVRLTSARSGARTTNSGLFKGGKFVVRQRSKDRGLTNLVLTGRELAGCRTGRGGARSSAKRSTRRLWGEAKGRFRTRGHRSAATVRGTRWLVEDRCDGTLTRVVEGVVVVKDFARRRTVTLRRGERYLARPTSR